MQDMTPQEAFDAWKAGDVAIVDVREQDEYDTTHVDGVPLVPMSEMDARGDEFPTGGPLVIMCRSGRRSAQVANALRGRDGRDDVRNLTGGIIAWAEAGLPYVGEPPQ